MNIAELSKMVSKETGEPVYKVKPIIVSVFKIIRQQVIKAQIIKIKNLLTIFIDVAPERQFYNIHENVYQTLPRRFILKIIPSAKLKKQIDAKKTY
jgi:nucleoid DNA-binding protein